MAVRAELSMQQGLHDAGGSVAVAIGVVGHAHRPVGGGIVQQASGARHQNVGLGADQLHGTGGRRFRRSIVSDVTSTGLPSEGAPFCTPPESVIISALWRIRLTNGR